tara:strand:- start:361 stop:762 length:402 start_codon:yes stop_codon:yes gene_type:complete
MSLGNFALQSTIYSTLSGDSTLTSTLGASVFDDVPESTSFPYVVLGEDNIQEFGTKDVDGTDTTLTLHIWSEYKGSKETKEIMDRIHDLLHDSSLSVSGFNLINLRFEFSDIMRDPDGKTRHGVMRFRAVLLG